MKSCPKCHVGGIEIGEELTAKPLGTWSLAGAQLKTVAQMYTTASCSSDACDWKVYGHLENPTFDNRGTFTGGHFVVDVPPSPTDTPDE